MNFLKRIDLALLVPTVGLIGISLAIIASTAPSLFLQQLIFSLVGFILFVIFSAIDFRVWPKFFWIFYISALFFLVVTFFGQEIRGSHRWITLGWLRIQPSELIKPFFVVILAELFSRSQKSSIWSVFKPVIFFLPILILIFKQPDLGNVLVYLFTFLTITTLSDISFLSLLASSAILVAFLPISWFFLKEYQRARILSFLDPSVDPKGAGYNALQAIIAIGSGRIFGLGLGHGTQSHLRFLPEYHTDFVFAAIGEELGFLGSILVIFFYATMLMRILKISSLQKTKFAKFLSIGIFAQLFVQVFINVGMNLGILPITGITLPFLSYGGSSLFSTFIGLGIVANIGQRVSRETPIEIK